MRDEARIRRQCERGAQFKRLRKESAPHREKNFQILSKKVFGNNFPYEGATIFERILKCATKHASAGNASEERGLRDC
jgi:hypothetical protein